MIDTPRDPQPTPPMPPTSAATDIATRDALRVSAHPRRFPNMSGRMAAVLGYLLGQAYTEVTIIDLSMTSECYVTAMTTAGTEFFGPLHEIEENLRTLAASTQGTSHPIDDAGLAYLVGWLRAAVT